MSTYYGVIFPTLFSRSISSTLLKIYANLPPTEMIELAIRYHTNSYSFLSASNSLYLASIRYQFDLYNSLWRLERKQIPKTEKKDIIGLVESAFDRIEFRLFIVFR